MQATLKAVVLASAALLAPAAAMADHNSTWGAGWARMPNDIHNTRIETRGDNTTFRDFVRRGNGAESVNRYEPSSGSRRDSTTTGSRQQSRQRKSR
jgi:hypothetical protein